VRFDNKKNIFYNFKVIDWGRKGLDGDNEAEAACRGSTNLVKKVEKKKCRNSACRCLKSKAAIPLAFSRGA